MIDMIKAGGLLMYPIILCSVIAVTIVIERYWSLRRSRVIPENLMAEVYSQFQHGHLSDEYLVVLRDHSPLGRVLATGIGNRQFTREVMKESIEEEGRQVVYQLERYLNTLGMIASVTPLLGLLGTVIGMIEVFTAIVDHGVGNPDVLAGGISKALITTAAGLSVAIPALVFHRYLSGKVDELTLGMEEQAVKLVEVIHGERRL
ncbi:MAG: MotA/TolQ/ExbB proton channel family protein [Pseudomonadota bacterium]